MLILNEGNCGILTGILLSKHFMQTYKNQTELNLALIAACKKGDLELTKYLLISPKLEIHADIDFNNSDAFRWACNFGHLEIVQYMLCSPELRNNGIPFANLHANNDDGFVWACGNGHLEVVKYLLTSPELKEAGHTHPSIHADQDKGFQLACSQGMMQMVQYLLTSRDLVEHINIYDYNSVGLILACQSGHLDLIKFFITSPELVEHSNPNNAEAFKTACENEKLEVIEYLIFEAGITLNNSINDYLNKPNNKGLDNEVVLRLFQLRDLGNKLKENLSVKTNTSKKIKL